MRVTVKDTVGVPVDSWSDYYPFGKEARGSSTSSEPKEQFTGKERDAETGLDYFGARYYNADIGRWTRVEPLSRKYPSLSSYAYTANNPVILIDPDGRDIVFIGGAEQRKAWDKVISTLRQSSRFDQLYRRLEGDTFHKFVFRFGTVNQDKPGFIKFADTSPTLNMKTGKLTGTNTVVDRVTIGNSSWTSKPTSVEDITSHEFKHVEQILNNLEKFLENEENAESYEKNLNEIEAFDFQDAVMFDINQGSDRSDGSQDKGTKEAEERNKKRLEDIEKRNREANNNYM